VAEEPAEAGVSEGKGGATVSARFEKESGMMGVGRVYKEWPFHVPEPAPLLLSLKLVDLARELAQVVVDLVICDRKTDEGKV